MKNSLLRHGLYSFVGAAAGLAVCFGVGFMIVLVFGSPPSGFIGVGFDRWNLPGTILGAATLWVIAFYLPEKRKRKG